MFWRTPIRLHLTIILVLCVIGTILSWWYFTDHHHTWKHWLANWLLVVNLVTVGYYGVDKLLARSGADGWRVPELALHTLGAIGGSPGALLAMYLFRHKTIKTSFRILFWGIVILQVALTLYIVKLLWWN